MAKLRLVVMLLLVVLVESSILLAMATSSRTIRIALHKETSMDGGPLGQPITSYFTKIDVGTPPKSFNMLIDINAAEVWLPHFDKLGWRLNYHKGYSKADSLTSIKEPNAIYGFNQEGCELSGKAYRDVIRFCDVVGGNHSVKIEQRFLAIRKASNDKFSKYPAVDGVLALGPLGLSMTGSFSIVQNMIGNLISEAKLGLALSSNLSSHAGGELAIGGPNQDMFPGVYDIIFHKTVVRDLWELALERVMLGGNSNDACPGSNISGPRRCTAILSTTVNDIYGPPSIIRQLLKQLGVQSVKDNFDPSKLYEIDCLEVANAPALTFVIGGANYQVPPTAYIKRMIQGFFIKTNTCYVALLANHNENRWELGTSFLSNFYTIFDISEREVAFEQLL